MSIAINGAMSRLARAKSGLTLGGFLFILGAGATIPPAAADNGALYVAAGPSTLIAPPVGISREQLSGTVRKLGDLLGDSLKSPSHATDVVVTTKCGHYLSATISYADGTAKFLSLGNAPASQSDMDKAKAAITILRIIDEPGC